jgi:hypothetical protein
MVRGLLPEVKGKPFRLHPIVIEDVLTFPSGWR